MTIAGENPVATPCNAYNVMHEHWRLIDDLRGGTLAMRKAGVQWLPKEPKEDILSYQNRLNRSILFDAYKDTCEDLSARPFSREVTLKGELNSELLSRMYDNCDKNGTNLTQFAKECIDTLIDRGLTHILVDHPAMNTENGEPLSIAAEQENDIRPYFVHIKPENLIGWKYYKDSNGQKILSQIRYKEVVDVDDGVYGTKIVERIRVFTRNTWEIHEKQEKEEKYVMTESGTHTFGGVPLITCYINKTGYMQAFPVMEPLAWANLDHWHQNSDLKNAYRYLSWPILFIKGLSGEEIENEVIIGPGRKISSTNPDADGKYIEHSGQSTSACRQGVMDIEERMITLGLDPLMSRPGNQTATGQSIDESKSQCSLQSWINALSKALKQSYELAAKWIGEELPEDFDVSIYSDFGFGVRATEDIKSLITMRQAGEISRDTFLREVKRRALIADNIDVQEEIERIDSEPPKLSYAGMYGSDDGGQENA